MIADNILGLVRKISFWINTLVVIISLLSSIEFAETKIDKLKSFFWYWYKVTPTDPSAIGNDENIYVDKQTN